MRTMTADATEAQDAGQVASNLAKSFNPRLPIRLGQTVDVEWWIARVIEAHGHEAGLDFVYALRHERAPLGAARLIGSIDYSGWGPEVVAEAWLVCAALIAELGEEQRLDRLDDYGLLMGLV